MPLIEAPPDELFRQAHMTATDYMREAVQAIDEMFGEGYAALHPELVGAFMRTAAADLATALATSVAEQSADKIASAIGTLAEAVASRSEE